MENFDLLVLVFILLNVGAALFKKRRKRNAAQRPVPVRQPLREDVPDVAEQEEEEEKRQLLKEDVFDILQGWQDRYATGEAGAESTEERESGSVSHEAVEDPVLPEPVHSQKSNVGKKPYRAVSNGTISVGKNRISRLLRDRKDLRNAILLAEVLGPPRALKPN